MLRVKEKDARFLTFMAVFAGLIFLLYREEVVGPLLRPLATLTAQATLAVLQWSSVEALRAATVISHPSGFAYEVAYSCVGLLPVVFLAAAVLGYPAALVHCLVGLMIGIPILLTLNLGRLVHLFSIGVHDRALFDSWHEDLWPTIIRLTIIGLWISWVYWAEHRSGSRPHRTCPFELRVEGLSKRRVGQAG